LNFPHIRPRHLIDSLCHLKELTQTIYADWLYPGLVSAGAASSENMVAATDTKVGKIVHRVGHKENTCRSQQLQ